MYRATCSLVTIGGRHHRRFVQDGVVGGSTGVGIRARGENVRRQSTKPKTNNSSSNTNSSNSNNKRIGDESHLSWKERSKAPRWMQRIAPTKGGKISELKPYEITALLAGCGVFYYAWFVAEPPKPKPLRKDSP
mmetsp:Transcript_24094/g.53348  ORF Transcript_24094/g.53348 Transcript_24094/m.53348 type:complete len:134 (+) Transcript_24094:118-519(+)